MTEIKSTFHVKSVGKPFASPDPPRLGSQNSEQHDQSRVKSFDDYQNTAFVQHPHQTRFNIRPSNRSLNTRVQSILDNYSHSNIFIRDGVDDVCLKGDKSKSRNQIISTPHSPIDYDAPFVNPGYRQPLLSKQAKMFFE